MKILLKIIIMATIGLVYMARNIENTANGDIAPISNIISTVINIVRPNNQQESKQPLVRQRMCKLKPNGDEECWFLDEK